MTKTYSLYEAATGLFTGKRLHCDEEGLLSARLPAGTLAMEGSFDERRQVVDLATGAVVDYHPPLQSKAATGAETRTAVIYARIMSLEASQGRTVREATLGDPIAINRLKDIDAEIRDLRKELVRR
jgi:hypothetical protein